MFGIGLRIKQIRETKNFSAAAFAEHIDISRNQVYLMEKDGNFGLDMVHKILDSFPDINQVWLLTGIGSMYGGHVAEPEDAASYELKRTAKTHAAFAEASLDAIAEELSDAERRLLFDTSQQLRQFSHWRRGVEETLAELREEIRQVKESINQK